MVLGAPRGDRITEHSDQPHWLSAVPRAVVVLDPRGLVLGCSAVGAELLGRTVDTLTGAPFAATVLAEPDRGGFEEVLALAASGVDWQGRLRLPSGAVHVEAVPAPRGPAGQACLPGRACPVQEVVLTLTADGPDRDRAVLLSALLARLVRVGADLQAADDLSRLTEVVVSRLADAVGATTGSLSVLVDDHTLSMVGVRGGTPGAADRWSRYPADDATPAGSVIATRTPLLLVGREAIADRYPDLVLAAPGERTLLCLPLVRGGRSLGVITLTFPVRWQPGEAETEFYSVLSDSCAQALERIGAQQTVAQQTAKLSLVADASATLAASLDYESTLRTVARLAVPRFADWCRIALDQDGTLRTLAVAHGDPDRVALAEELQRRYPVDPDEDTGAHQVLRTGQTSYLPVISDEVLVAAARDPQHLRMLRALSITSGLTVALTARGRVFGIVSWARGEGREPFEPADVTFAEDLARRAATAIDNSLLHSELRAVADSLHDAVLPADLPEVAGWQLAATYSPAGRAGVGGDFYDVLPLPDGRLALAMGDVMGRGVQAAASMAQVKAALRTIVAVEADPAEVLTRLDLYYERYPSDQLVTLLYAVADLAAGTLTLACAGHPPALLRSADGTVAYLDQAGGTILGAGAAGPRTATTVRLEAGQTLLLYTDGLLERRGEDLEDGRRRLLAHATTLPSPPTSADLAALAAEVRDPTRDDDVAVLAAHLGVGDAPVEFDAWHNQASCAAPAPPSTTTSRGRRCSPSASASS